jgi:hypothetical protein
MTNYYQWFKKLIRECASTPRFISVKVHKNENSEILYNGRLGTVPADYSRFLLEFGSASLFRDPSDGQYRIELRQPVDMPKLTTKKALNVITIGKLFAAGVVCYRLGVNETLTDESPIWITDGANWRKVGDNFESWLFDQCKKEKKRLGLKWQAIVAGPTAFSPTELEIVRTRKEFKISMLNHQAGEGLKVKVTNESTRFLPCLTVRVSIGVLGTAHCSIPVAHVSPGNSREIELDWPKLYGVPPRDFVLEALDIGPEDREFVDELRSTVSATGATLG